MTVIIKGFIKKLFGGWNNIKWIGHGVTPDNAMVGEMYQHYGFKSYPPESPEADPRIRAIIVNDGNNLWSVAERDLGFEERGFAAGNTMVYADSTLSLQGNEIAYWLSGDTTAFFGMTNISGKPNLECSSEFSVKNPHSVNTYYLVTEKFLTDFCAHTHGVAGAVTTGVATVSGTGTITPIMLNGDLSKTLKGD